MGTQRPHSAWTEVRILLMSRDVEETTRWTTVNVTAIRTLSDNTASFVRTRLPKLYSRKLVDRDLRAAVLVAS